MTFDAKVPSQLKKSQKWFASIITRPIDEDSRMNPVSPTGNLMEEEAWDFIHPSPTLRPAQRIQIYNQQYWWRLLSTLHEVFPLLTRLFGYYEFNQSIGIPYLVKYAPNHWSLNQLGDRLPQWIQEEYKASDKALVYDASMIDFAFNSSFVAPENPPITQAPLASPGDFSSLMSPKIYLQPHIHLFKWDYDIFQFRTNFLLQEVEYWIENDFPALPKDRKYYFVLFRNSRNDIAWNEITSAEYHVLKKFQEGSSIDDLCQWLEQQDPAISDPASEKIHIWLQEWILRGWLTLTSP